MRPFRLPWFPEARDRWSYSEATTGELRRAMGARAARGAMVCVLASPTIRLLARRWVRVSSKSLWEGR